MQAGQSVIEDIKSINIKDVVYMSAAAWDDISALTLTTSWNKLLASNKTTESDQQPENADSQEQSVESLAKELDPNLSDEDITNRMKESLSDPGYQLFSDEKIIQQVVSPSAEEDTDMEDDEDQDEPTTTISSGQATDMLEQCLNWYE